MTTRMLVIVAAILCFLVALLLATGVFSGGNEEAWKVGGLLALALAQLPPRPL